MSFDERRRSPCRSRILYPVALGALVFAWVCWAGVSKERWAFLGVAQMEGWFDDWAAVLAAAETWANGGDPWQIPHHADPYGRPHVYGPGWFALGLAGFGLRDVVWQGWIMVLSFVGFVASWFRVRDVTSLALAALALFSFPVMLGINRANNDLVVLMMIGLAAWMSGRAEPAAGWLAALLVAAASLLKFYPVVAVVALLTGPVLERRYWIRWICVLVATVGAGLAQWEEISRSLAVVPRAFTAFSYGAWQSWNLVFTDAFGPVFLMGKVAGVALVGLWSLKCVRSWWRLIPTGGSEAFFLVASITVWCACLCAGASFAYRAVWLLPLVAHLFVLRGRAADRPGWNLAFLMLFLGCSSAKAVLLLNLAPHSGFAMRILQFVAGVEHPLVLGTLLMGGLMLIGWFTRRTEELRANRRLPRRSCADSREAG